MEGYQPRPFGCEVGSQFHHGHVSRGPPIVPDSRFSQVRFETLAFLPWAFPSWRSLSAGSHTPRLPWFAYILAPPHASALTTHDSGPRWLTVPFPPELLDRLRIQRAQLPEYALKVAQAQLGPREALPHFPDRPLGLSAQLLLRHLVGGLHTANMPQPPGHGQLPRSRRDLNLGPSGTRKRDTTEFCLKIDKFKKGRARAGQVTTVFGTTSIRAAVQVWVD